MKCKYCKKRISKKATICPYCNQSQISLFKPILIIICILIGGIASLTDNKEEKQKETQKENQYNKIEYVETKKENYYMEEIIWAELSSYAFAVEIDNYNGDIVSEGSYKFAPYMVVDGKVPQVWDIYVSENYYSNIKELQDSEYICTVGGIGNYATIVDLKKNQYVYIKTIDMATESTGALKITKQ